MFDDEDEVRSPVSLIDDEGDDTINEDHVPFAIYDSKPMILYMTYIFTVGKLRNQASSSAVMLNPTRLK